MNKNQLFLAISIMAVPCVQAAEWSLTAKLNPSVEYDDNVYMSENNKDSGTRYATTPTATVSRADENSNVNLSIGYRLARWSSVNKDDQNDPFAKLTSAFSTERSQYGLDLGYAQDDTSNTAADNGGNFRSTSTQTTKTVAPWYSYNLTELDTLSLKGSYTDNDYDSGFGGNDNKLKSLTTDWMHQYTERLSAGLSVGAYNYKANSALTSFSVKHDNYNLLALMTYQLSELWTIDGRIGGRHMKSKLTDDFGFKEKHNSSGTSYNATVSRQDEIDTLTFGASQELSPNTNGSVDQQQRLNVNWSRSLSDTLSTSISASYIDAKSASRSVLKEKRKYYELSPSIRWQFQQNLGLSLSYKYRKQKRDLGQLNSDATGNSVMLGLNYDWDGIRASR